MAEKSWDNFYDYLLYNFHFSCLPLPSWEGRGVGCLLSSPPSWEGRGVGWEGRGEGWVVSYPYHSYFPYANPN
ncbi:hypothetical protein CYANOKiyG1_57490 [Okeania sp. KiyG1]|nr:hypothetical protein CYANOKiyG1_57490 [Okeania sp. KiyG1]